MTTLFAEHESVIRWVNVDVFGGMYMQTVSRWSAEEAEQ